MMRVLQLMQVCDRAGIDLRVLTLPMNFAAVCFLPRSIFFHDNSYHPHVPSVAWDIRAARAAWVHSWSASVGSMGRIPPPLDPPPRLPASPGWARLLRHLRHIVSQASVALQRSVARAICSASAALIRCPQPFVRELALAVGLCSA